MTNKQIIVNNLLVSYFRNENAGEKCLLFLHGWRSNKEIWLRVINQLKEKSYAIDFPGFGGSQMPKGAMTVGDYADAVKEFIEKLDLKNVIVVGHSFGGRVGIKLAAKYPNLISGLVLVDSAGFPMKKFKKDLMAAAAKIARPIFKPNFMQPIRKKIYEKIGAEDYIATPELQKTFVNVVNEDLTEDLKRISCPTLIITGENDQDTPIEFGEKMNSLIPNSKFIILPNAGHFSFIDLPREFCQNIINFIQS